MIEKIVVFVSGIIFGKQYFDGYVKEPEEKPEYRIVPLFPNEVAKEKAMNTLKK